MAKSAVNIKVALLVVFACMFVSDPRVEAAVTCEQVTIWLTPCISYGVLGGVVPQGCCEGVKALHAASTTTADRRLSCSCIQKGAAGIPGINYDRINTLGDTCGSPCPYKVYPTTDCSKMN